MERVGSNKKVKSFSDGKNIEDFSRSLIAGVRIDKRSGLFYEMKIMSDKRECVQNYK